MKNFNMTSKPFSATWNIILLRECSFAMRLPRDMLWHVRTVEKCLWDKYLMLHRKTLHSDSRYQCNACKRTFNRKDSFERHKWLMHKVVSYGDYQSTIIWYCIYQLLQKKFYCNDHTITEFGIIDSKNSSIAYVILYELIDTWFLDSKRKVGVWSLPWRWHILSIPLTTGRGTGAETCGLDGVFPPDDLCSPPEALC